MGILRKKQFLKKAIQLDNFHCSVPRQIAEYKFKQNPVGMTLIEVLIALSIVAIAMTAVIKATTQNISGTLYVQNKMIATWVGMQVVNELRTGILSTNEDKLEDKTDMLGQTWYWEAVINATGNPHIQQVTVLVSNREDVESHKLVTLESYLYHAE